MNRVAWILFTVAAVLCAPAFAAVIGDNDDQVKAVADPLLDNMLDGMKSGDYAKYSKDVDAAMKAAVTPEAFAKSNKQIRVLWGNYKSRSYLGFLVKGDATVVVWKARFDNSQDDVLIKLTVSKQGDKCLVAGLRFQ